MGIKMWKILKGMFCTALFCGYFYVLFVNLVCGFSMSGIESRWDALKVLVCYGCRSARSDLVPAPSN